MPGEENDVLAALRRAANTFGNRRIVRGPRR